MTIATAIGISCAAACPSSFNEQLEQALHSIDVDSRPLAVAYLDIDYFKRVNDNFGHDVGDELLKALGQRIECTLKHSDIVARLGGDEFALIMPQLAAADDVIAVASRILASIRQPVVIGRHRIRVTASVGFAIAGVHDTVATLLGRADKASTK